MHVVVRAAIQGSGLERVSPHLLIRHAMGTDEPDTVELVCELPNIRNVSQAEIQDDDIRTLLVNEVLDLVDIARDAYALEVGMQFCCEVFGHNAIRLGHDHITWFHDSLSFTAPSGAANGAFH